MRVSNTLDARAIRYPPSHLVGTVTGMSEQAQNPKSKSAEILAAEQVLQAKADERDQAYKEAHRKSHELWEAVADSPLNISQIARALGVSRGAVHSWLRQLKEES